MGVFERWSERQDLNLRPLVPQTSALTGLRHAPSKPACVTSSVPFGKAANPKALLLFASAIGDAVFEHR